MYNSWAPPFAGKYYGSAVIVVWEIEAVGWNPHQITTIIGGELSPG